MIYTRFFVFFSICFLAFQPAYSNTQGIAAVVNDDAISFRDLQKRMRLIMASSGLPDTQDVRDKIIPQVLGNLIDETLMLQEAERIGINVDQNAIDNGFSAIAQQNKMDAERFSLMLKKGGVDVSTLRAQVKAQLAWKEFVQKRLRSRVVVSERDIDDAFERFNSKMGSTEYLTAEIFLPTNDQASQKEAFSLAQRLHTALKRGEASFFQLAQQFSKAAGAADGGDNGWLNETQIKPEILKSLSSVSKKQITNIIKTSSGYHILFLRDKREVSEDSIPSRDQIGFDLGSKRLDRVQRRHLQDLKASAFLDIRV